MLTALPYDILVLILDALDHDLPTLRSLTLVCHALLPTVREALFSTVNVCALQEPYMRPLLQHTTALRIEEPNPISTDVLAGRFVPHLHPAALPRLRALHLTRTGVWFFVKVPTAFFRALEALRSVTALALSGEVFFVGLAQIQTLLRALPSLAELVLADVAYFPWKGAMPEGYAALAGRLAAEAEAGARGRPRLRKLTVAPTAPTDDVLGWLGAGPCAESLTTLVVPPLANAPHFVLKHFGPRVEHLGVPFHGRGYRACYSRCLRAYTHLRTFTAHLDTCAASPRAWTVLPFLLASALPATHLHTLTLAVRVPYPALERSAWVLDAHLDWDVLAQLDGVLADAEGGRLAALRRVVVEVCWVGAWIPTGGVREALVRRIEGVMARAKEAGRLVVELKGVRVVYPRVYWRGNRESAV